MEKKNKGIVLVFNENKHIYSKSKLRIEYFEIIIRMCIRKEGARSNKFISMPRCPPALLYRALSFCVRMIYYLLHFLKLLFWPLYLLFIMKNNFQKLSPKTFKTTKSVI